MRCPIALALNGTSVSANKKHTFCCAHANIRCFFSVLFSSPFKGISKEIEFRYHNGKILTLRHNQSNVCYVRDKGRK